MLTLTKINGRYREQRLASFGADISNMQFGMLRVLSLGEQTLSELSRHMVLDPTTLVPAVAKLRRRGLIQSRRDRRDRRRAPLSLTDKGRTLIEEISNFEDDDPIFAAVNALGPEKSEQLVGLLRELMESTPEGKVLLEEMHLRMVAHGACLPPDVRQMMDEENSKEKSSP
ncbi:MAG: winged helix DNA-binding protein [Anaerolineae bacterium]|nr:winged helix DNA-binding protein [Anaerolineae bacterium]